jgi:hypothetical protein
LSVRVPTFRSAIEDARGVVALFAAQKLPEDDCVPAVREAIENLDAVLGAALERDAEGKLTAADKEAVEKQMRDLLLLWGQCGQKTQAFMLDMKTLFGRYITLG